MGLETGTGSRVPDGVAHVERGPRLHGSAPRAARVRWSG
ncbi:hypothetical protein ABIC85_001117 [Oerskovia enterophila]